MGTLKSQLSKTKKTNQLLFKLEEIAINEGKLEYAKFIHNRIIENNSKISNLNRMIVDVAKNKSWFNFLAK